MTCVSLARRCALGLLLCLGLGGCFPSSDNQLDEKKEPHFITGKNLVGQMDYQGAIDSYEKALEANPRSASAHFELAWLYEEKMTPADPVAAIYHYDRYLKYSVNPDKADLVRQHINGCKLELAKTVSVVGPLPSQRELEKALIENKDLRAQTALLQSQLEQARAAIHTPTPTPPPPSNLAGNPGATKPLGELARNEDSKRGAGANGSSVPHSVSAASKTHVITHGDTLGSVARKYGVSVEALKTANPRVKPTYLQVGQTLNIPSA